MKKKVSIFFLITCFTLIMCAGVASATNGTGMTTQSSNNGNQSVISSNGMTDTTANYRANAVSDDNDTDWGWLGLLGLIGLAGLRKRNHETNH